MEPLHAGQLPDRWQLTGACAAPAGGQRATVEDRATRNQSKCGGFEGGPLVFCPYDTVTDAILTRYEERKAKKKEAKRKEAQAQQLVQAHVQQDNVWEQCFL